MKNKYIGILCMTLLSACGNYVTRDELQRSQTELRTELTAEDLAVHTCAQSMGQIQQFSMICQFTGVPAYCAAVHSYVESCLSSDENGGPSLPQVRVWERLTQAAEEAGFEQPSSGAGGATGVLEDGTQQTEETVGEETEADPD